MKEAIKKAVEGGWKEHLFTDCNITDIDLKSYEDNYYIHFFDNVANQSDMFSFQKGATLLDTLFWQSLGKAMGWGGGDSRTYWTREDTHKIALLDRWQNEMHSFIDHLAEGKDVDSFFNELLK